MIRYSCMHSSCIYILRVERIFRCANSWQMVVHALNIVRNSASTFFNHSFFCNIPERNIHPKEMIKKTDQDRAKQGSKRAKKGKPFKNIFLSLFGFLFSRFNSFYIWSYTGILSKTLLCFSNAILCTRKRYNLIWWMNSYRKNKETSGNKHTLYVNVSALHKRIQTHMGFLWTEWWWLRQRRRRQRWWWWWCRVWMCTYFAIYTSYAFRFFRLLFCSHFYHYLYFTFYCSLGLKSIRKIHLPIGIVRTKIAHILAQVRVSMYFAQ